jgi:hypothetical protein
MRKLLSILFVALLLTSCISEGDVEGLDGIETAMDVHKFEHEGNHYIQFNFSNIHGGGVTLDPDYMFQGDTIVYGGNKYVKLNQ